jgi:hypothetical protein
MPRNIPNKPHRTPNPDQPHTSPGPERIGSGSAGQGEACRAPAQGAHAAPGQGVQPRQQPGAQEPDYDSCFDDLNVVLSQSIDEPDPDPNLESVSDRTRAVGDEPVPPPRPDGERPPRTSEIFRSVGPKLVDIDPESAQQCDPAVAPIREKRPGDVGVVVPRRAMKTAAVLVEDEQLPEAAVSWAHVLLLSYASATTLALGWILWTGRSSRIAQPSPAAVQPADIEPPSRAGEAELAHPAPPIPAENLTTLGKSIQVGSVKITPLAVVATRLERVRAIQPAEFRQEKAESLVLRLRITNLSSFRAFVPLGPDLVRDRGVRPHDPYVAASDGSIIRLFALAFESEWSIRGQTFPILQPGDTAETMIAAEPGSGRDPPAEMTWRVRLRTGVYRTDMVGVRFSRDEVRHVSRLQEPGENDWL